MADGLVADDVVIVTCQSVNYCTVVNIEKRGRGIIVYVFLVFCSRCLLQTSPAATIGGHRELAHNRKITRGHICPTIYTMAAMVSLYSVLNLISCSVIKKPKAEKGNLKSLWQGTVFFRWPYNTVYCT